MVIKDLMELLKLRSESFGDMFNNKDILSDKSDKKNCSSLKLLNDR